MAIFEKVAQKYIQDNFDKKEAELALEEDRIRTHFAKSREYREKLHKYYRLLKDRDAELLQRETSINIKEAELEEKEILLAEKVKESVMQPLEMERDKIKAEISSLKKEVKGLESKKTGIQNAEYRIIEWATRIDNKERSIYDKIVKDADKFQQYKLSVDGYGFESYTADLLVKNGYQNVTVTQKSRDFGADVLAEKDGVKYVFQCKYYSSQVGIEAVQQVYSAKTYYDAHVAVVVTNNVFTTAAKILAEELRVILWDCEYLSVLAKEKDIDYAKAENS